MKKAFYGAIGGTLVGAIGGAYLGFCFACYIAAKQVLKYGGEEKYWEFSNMLKGIREPD